MLVVFALVAATLGQGPTEGLAQSTADDFAAARQRLGELQEQANDLAARYAEAYAQSSALEQQILEIDSRIEGLVRDQRARRKVVGARVVDVYVDGANADAPSLLFDGDSAMDSARRALFAKLISDRDRNVLDDLRVLGQDVASVRDELRIAKTEQDSLASQLERETLELDDKLGDAQRIRDELGDRLVAEEAAERRAAEARARAASEARARTAAQETQTSGAASDDHSDPDVSPTAPDEPAVGGGSYGVEICPIRGAVAFTDTWGDPRPGGRSHQGVDLLSPSGTPNVAVTSGRIEQDYGDRMGNAIFFYGDNGNTYYYFHLSAFEGGPRDVAQGEVIGYVGSTGASGANHTHFEIHPGGGGAINPYDAARAVC
jgi:murein DD-endopeptidase MepM/ murein hydrolase activator NlpD